jgi:hypothetical protein
MKIPCFVLTWLDHDALKRQVDTVTAEYADRLDLIIVENKSRASETIIRPYLRQKVMEGLVHKCYFFQYNIGSSAMSIIRNAHVDYIRNCPYVITTDGDIIPIKKGWLEEEISILESDPNIHAVSLNLQLDNLPIDNQPLLAAQILCADGYGLAEPHEKYIELDTGHFFTLMRGPEYAGYLDWSIRRRKPQRDNVHRKYCNKILGKKWVKTKERNAINGSWSQLNGESPYFGLRYARDENHIFMVHRSCPYWEFNANGEFYHHLPTIGGSVFGNEFGE